MYDPFAIGKAQGEHSPLFVRGNQTEWTEDAFVFERDQGRNKATHGTARHVGSFFAFESQKWFLIAVSSVFILLLSRFFYLQIVQGSNFFTVAEGNRQRIVPIVSPRGLVFDRNGVQLTENVPNFILTLVPQDLPQSSTERAQMILQLAELTNQDPEELAALIREFGSYSFESIIIKEDLAYDEALRVYIATSDLPGIRIQRSSKRLYPNTKDGEEGSSPYVQSLSHILGYQGKLNQRELDERYNQGYLPSDLIGKTGVEKTHEETLRGVYGKRKIEVDARGREQLIISEEEAVPGAHLKLSIDLGMQEKLEQIMVEALDEIGAKRASGIVMDPRNGEILSMVSLPSYDANHFSGGVSSNQYKEYIDNKDLPLFNRAIAGTYPSGSTIKPLMSAIGLQEGLIDENTSFSSTGGIRIGPWFFPDWKAGGHGVTNVRKALAWSVNTFYYYIGGGHNDFTGLGVDTIRSYLTRLGFQQVHGVDLPGESVGFIPSREWKENPDTGIGEQWYIGDTYNLSIGQGYLLVTPLQIANSTAMIANDGTLYKPRVSRAIIDPETNEERTFETEEIYEGHIARSHLKTVKLGMRDCVVYGSCRRLLSVSVPVSGKTGTAQWHSEKETHAWFTSFAPFENPEIVVTILVEEGGGGADIAIPIADKFYRWWTEYEPEHVDETVDA